MKIMLVIFAMIVATLILWFAIPAKAHDWYAQRTDPQTNSRCCGGNDCAPVPLDADWIRPAKGGFHVVMTLEETRLVNPNSQAPVDEIVLWNRMQSPGLDANGIPALYHVCISAYPMGTLSRIFCLFAVPSL